MIQRRVVRAWVAQEVEPGARAITGIAEKKSEEK